MSRSYKHTPRSGDKKDKFYKNYSNRKLRRIPIEEESYPKHNNYKKIICSWEICDYESVGTTFEEYWNGLWRFWCNWRYRWEKSPPNKEDAYKDYCRWYLRK